MKEFEFIKNIIQKHQRELPPGVLGIGDDASAIPLSANHLQVSATDCLVESVHFDLQFTSLKDLGYKALAVNISDISSMGANPKWAHLSLAIPPHLELNDVEEFVVGFSELAVEAGIYLLGGDLSRSPTSFFINVVLNGEVEKSNLKTRGGFKPGTLLCTSAPLGDGLAGLRLAQQGKGQNAEATALKAQYCRPQLYIEQGVWLGQRSSVLGMMDCSDGLLSSLKQLQLSQKIGFNIDLEKIPISENLKSVSVEENWNSFEVAISGGDDYCLLIAAEAKEFENLQAAYANKFNQALYAIGEVTSDKLKFVKAGSEVNIDAQTFSHF